MSSLATTDRSGHQEILINVLKTIAGRADAYFWHFNEENDDGYNKGSLSHLLGIDHDDIGSHHGKVWIHGCGKKN